jgi:hypothetical protein
VGCSFFACAFTKEQAIDRHIAVMAIGKVFI